VQLQAFVRPANATNRAVRWHSTHPLVATVNSNGLITIRGVGTTAIWATSLSDSERSAGRALTILPSQIAVTSISVAGASSVTVGATTTFTNIKTRKCYAKLHLFNGYLRTFAHLCGRLRFIA